MNIDPVWAVWIALLLNIGGVVMMLGAKRQQLTDMARRLDAAETAVDVLDHAKLAVTDYHREQRMVSDRIGEVETRSLREAEKLDGRCTRIETRLDSQGFGGRR